MKMNVKVLAIAATGLIPAGAFAQENGQSAVAVALGASFQPVEMTNSVTLDDLSGTVVIPALDVAGRNNVWPYLPVSGSTTETTADVTFDNVPATETSTSMQLTSVSVAAAAGNQAVASAVSNSNGRTGANSGASMDAGARLSAEVETTRGGNYASEVLVGGGRSWN